MTERDRIGTNDGHGHAWPRPDGMKVRCGGVAICRACAVDAALVERWRHDPTAGAGPVDPKMVEAMKALATVLDEHFNGPGTKPEDKRIGFFLTTFYFDNPGRFNYISNADPLDVRTMLKDVLARLEGRMQAAGRT